MQQGNFQYLITAKFDAKGAADAKKSLKEIEVAAKATSDESVKASAKSEAATTKLTKSQRGLKDAIRGVALQFPILGRFAEAAINPLIGGVGLAVSTITGLYLWLRDTHKTLEDIIKVDAPAEFQRLAQAQQEAQLEAASHARELERVRNANQSIADSTNEIVQAIQARKVAEAEIDDAQKALDLARVNETEKKGNISATTAIQQRAAIEQAAVERRVDRENKASQEIIQARQSELAATQAAIAQTQSALDRLTAQAATLGSGDDLTRTIAAEAKKKTVLTEQLRKQRAFLALGQNSFGQGYLPQTDTAKQITSNQAKLDAVNRRLAALRSDEPGYRAEIQATAESSSAARSQLRSLTTRESALQRDLSRLSSDASASAAQRSTLLGLDTQRRQVDLSAATAVPTTAADQLQAAQIIGAAQTNPQGSVMDNVIAQLMELNARNNAALLESLAQTMSRIYQSEQITRETFQRRIDALEADYNRKLNYLQ